MNILILGIDGYIGHALALHLKRQGHEVSGIDNYARRNTVRSLTPIENQQRKGLLKVLRNNIADDFSPVWLRGMDAVVHLAEMPSAPWSMQSVDAAVATHDNNVNGTLRLLWALREYPHVHLIKLGTMGEYGTPDCRIPEGTIPHCCLGGFKESIFTDHDTDVECPMSGLPFPRSPGSFYHLTKVHDTHNIIFATKLWGLRATDIMQGVVYGLSDESPDLLTRFDYDEFFGTAINRFIVQALAGLPITPYGRGNQRRGFLPLRDSIKCIELALQQPPPVGTYRVFNQFASTYFINELAEIVQKVAREAGFDVPIQRVENPRVEAEEHYYEPAREKLLSMGYKPMMDMEAELLRTITILANYRSRINPEVIAPRTRWDGSHRRSEALA